MALGLAMQDQWTDPSMAKGAYWRLLQRATVIYKKYKSRHDKRRNFQYSEANSQRLYLNESVFTGMLCKIGLYQRNDKWSLASRSLGYGLVNTVRQVSYLAKRNVSAI